jgi:replication fork protection complex subunit Tof1/Swi1
LNVINQFLETPLDLGGKKARELLSKKARRRRRARRSPSTSDSDADEDEPVQKKQEKKKKEKETYKSAQFIEDSDGEYGDMDAFLEKEKQLRERTTAKAAAEGGAIGTMKATGTKKRRRKDGTGGNKKWKGGPDVQENKVDSDDSDIGVIAELEAEDIPVVVATPKPRPRPRPRPKPRVKNSLNVSSPLKDTDVAAPPASPDVSAKHPSPDINGVGWASIGTSKRKTRIVISDDEE